jgi:hypothetical protein
MRIVVMPMPMVVMSVRTASGLRAIKIRARAVRLVGGRVLIGRLVKRLGLMVYAAD